MEEQHKVSIGKKILIEALTIMEENYPGAIFTTLGYNRMLYSIYDKIETNLEQQAQDHLTIINSYEDHPEMQAYVSDAYESIMDD